MTDGTASGTTTIAATIGALTTGSVGTATGGGAGASLTGLTLVTGAAAALAAVNSAVTDVSNQRGAIGANINQLNAAANVASTESVNLSSAESSIRSTNYGQATSDLAKFQVLSQTGISALAQANSVQQEILKLLQ